MKNITDCITVQGATITFTMHHVGYGDSLPNKAGVFVLHCWNGSPGKLATIIKLPGITKSLHRDVWTALPASLFMIKGVHWTASYLEVDDPDALARYQFDLFSELIRNHFAA
jgi:hypothetical protein